MEGRGKGEGKARGVLESLLPGKNPFASKLVLPRFQPGGFRGRGCRRAHPQRPEFHKCRCKERWDDTRDTTRKEGNRRGEEGAAGRDFNARAVLRAPNQGERNPVRRLLEERHQNVGDEILFLAQRRRKSVAEGNTQAEGFYGVLKRVKN